MRWVLVVLKAVAGTGITVAALYGLGAGMSWLFDARWKLALFMGALVVAIFAFWIAISLPDNNRTGEDEK